MLPIFLYRNLCSVCMGPKNPHRDMEFIANIQGLAGIQNL